MGNLYIPSALHDLVRQQHQIMLDDAEPDEHIAEWQALDELLHPEVREELNLERFGQ